MSRRIKKKTLEFFEKQYKDEPSWVIGTVQPSLLEEMEKIRRAEKCTQKNVILQELKC